MTMGQWERLSQRIIDEQIDLDDIRISTMEDGQVHVQSEQAELVFFPEEWVALVADVQSGRFTLSTIN